MMRPHRQAHRALWPLLGLVVMFGFLLALALRPAPEAAAPPAATEPRK